MFDPKDLFTKVIEKDDGHGGTKKVRVNAPFKFISRVVGGFLAFTALWGSFYIVGGTEYAVERTPGGEMQGIVESGVHFKVPYLSSVHYYDMFQTAHYSAEDSSMKRINFADTYGGLIGGTIRFQLTSNPELLVAMHRAYANESNLLASGLKPVAKQLLTYTANQVTGENFMQGGQNDYQNRIEDQGNFGLYVTNREKILVKKNTSTVGINNQNPKDREQRDSFIYVNKIQLDKDGNKMRKPLPTTQYGIKVVQVTIDDFQPETKLAEFVNRKKAQIATRQTLVEQQENERQSAVTAELKGNRERVESRQAMLKDKDAAVIQAQKKVELEQKEADLQVVRKKKDLDVANMEKKIQKTKSESTIFQAQAIKAKGLAEAAVKNAMYRAVVPKIFLAEVDRDIQLAKYKALPNVKLTMPNNVMITGGGKGSTAVDDLANIQIIDKIGQMK